MRPKIQIPLEFWFKVRNLREKLTKKYGRVFGRGRHRTVFASDKYVVKIPHHEEGQKANEEEHQRYVTASAEDKLRMAKCKLKEIGGLKVVIMERVQRAYDLCDYTPREADLPDECPEWIDEDVDCRQVGYDRKGNLVAFDYAGF